jgi:hypothetical protein
LKLNAQMILMITHRVVSSTLQLIDMITT